MDIDDNNAVVTKYNSRQKVGIKHPNFTPDGKNGQSHRKNKAKKQAQYHRNVATRADLYARFQGSNQGRGVEEFHSTLKALSGGNA
jgi:hypothetical protein